MSKLSDIIRRDCLSLWRQPADILLPLAFFVLVLSLFPIAITTDPKLLQKIAPGVIWVSTILAMLMAMSRLFWQDYHDGCLEQWWLQDASVIKRIVIRVFVFWLFTALPICLLLPVFALMYQLSFDVVVPLLMTLLLGTPILWLLGALVASLTLGLSQGSALLALLLLPLCIPVMIFSIGWVTAAKAHFSIAGPAFMMLGLLVIALYAIPFTIRAALKLAVTDS